MSKYYRLGVCCAVIMIGLFTVANLAVAGQLGPPEPTARPGRASVSVGYDYVEQKVKSSALAEDLILQSNQGFVQASYSPFKNWEGYLRVGAADMKDKETELRDDKKFFGGLGVRGLLYDNGMFGFGPFAQGNWYSNYKDSVSGTVAGASVKVTLALEDIWDATAGLAAQIKTPAVTIYGGPYAYWTNMTLRANASARIAGIGILAASDSTTLKETNSIGGFLGLRFPISKEIGFNIEGRYTSRASGGAMLTFAF